MKAEAEKREGGATAATKVTESRATIMYPEHQATKGYLQALKSTGTCTAGLLTHTGPVAPLFLPFSPSRIDLRLWEMLGWGTCIFFFGGTCILYMGDQSDF